MGSKQRSPSSDSSSSSESEEEQALQRPPPAKNPSLKSTSPKTKPSKSPQPPSSDDEEDEDSEPPVSQKKDQKKKEVSLKKDEKKNEEDEEEGSSDEEDEKQQQEEDEDDDDEGSGTSDDEKQQLSKKPDSMAISASGSDSDSEKPAAAGIVTPAPSGRKRPRDSAPSEPENTEKKKPFQRIWGVDDEIKILKAIIAFYSDNGREPPSNTFSSADMDAIYSLTKKSLGLEFTRCQLRTKIRGLRSKYQTNASQLKNNTNPKFSNPQQQDIYELSKKIWRPDNPNPNEARKSSGSSVKSKGKSALKILKDQEASRPDPCYESMWRAVAQAEHGDISWALIKRGLKLVDTEKARTLEKRFFKLELARMRHRLQWLDKREEAIQLVIDSMKKSG